MNVQKLRLSSAQMQRVEPAEILRRMHAAAAEIERLQRVIASAYYAHEDEAVEILEEEITRDDSD